ncbi:MAG: thioredoxin domain-containing protein [Deltaproteobacteria bacterium]|jgi:protein-disulfide isomerase|nr:thioredoxin domain-containing protein [Deltaproteobacteria bacterium]
MMCQLRTTAIACCLFATLACQQFGQNPDRGAGSGESADAVAATLDGQTITIGDVDEHIKEQLFSEATSERNPATLYEVRTRALKGLIDTMLVEKAAAAADLTSDDYLRQQVEAQGDVPEAEISAFYNENIDQMGGLSLDEMRERIGAYLKEQRVVTVVANLRDQADAEILLEPSRIEVEAIGPAKGPDDAVVTIIEFSDFQCPFCQRVVPTIDQIAAKYPTQVRIVFRNLPLNNIHPRAQAAAEAAACANNQGKFWDYHDLIFANNRALSDEDLERYASEVGLEMADFRQCVQNRETQQIVDADTAVAETLQISGTPSFLINGIPMHGAQSLEAFSEVIDAEIARSASGASEATR